ncbi:hypothetical protein ACA910_016676 [Epithemia clementina (nom. ined.)]
MGPNAKRKAASNSSSGHAAATSPFKRLKAKVGKKAPKPANSTDTNFRSASIHIKNQQSSLPSAVGKNNNNKNAPDTQQQQLVLTSGRGRSLQELMGQMHHPAANVRLSAIKGVHDIVQQHTTTQASIAANLSTLISAIGKASVDEEDCDVRQIGLQVFQSLLVSSGSRIKPFLPLTLAFLKSALNSLDRDTRRDGLRYVHTLAQSMQQQKASATTMNGLGDAAIPILPAIVRMWDDKAFQCGGVAANQKEATNNNNGNSKKKKKRKQKQQQQQQGKDSSTSSLSLPTSIHHTMPPISNGKYLLLDCLLALLSGIDPSPSFDGADYEPSLSSDRDSSRATIPPNLTFVPGGSSKNALFFFATTHKTYGNRTTACLESVQHMPSFASQMTNIRDDTRSNHHHHLQGTRSRLDLDTAHNLLLKFRDTLIELQQSFCLATFHLLSKVLDLFWQVFGHQLLSDQARVKSSLDNRIEAIRAVSEQIRALLLDSFPIQPSSSASTALADNVNGQSCLTLVHMTHFIDQLLLLTTKSADEQKKRSSHWLKPVVDYICNRLHDKSLIRPGNEESRESILRVLHNLLSGNSNQNIVQTVPRLEKKLVEAFVANVVVPDGVTISRVTARTKPGLTCVEIAAMLFRNVNHDLDRAHQVFGDLVLHIASTLPDFLVAFEGDYIVSSATIIQVLSRLFSQRQERRDDKATSHPTDDKDHQVEVAVTTITSRIRRSLEQVVDPERICRENGCKYSILESYPTHVQRQLVNLLATLRFPTETTLTFLSDLCARSNLNYVEGSPDFLSDEVSSYIVHSIFYIRKTIPMQQFLSFLVDSTGATRSTSSTSGDDDKDSAATLSEKRLARFDQGVREVSKCLVCCGLERIIPIMCPLLQLFVEDSSSSATSLLRQRFAFSILAVFALDHKSRGNGSILPLLPDDLQNRIPTSIFVSLLQRTETTDDFSKAGSLFMTPVVALLYAVPSLLCQVVQVVLGKLSSVSDESGQCKILHWLIDLIQNAICCSFSSKTIQTLIVDTKSLECDSTGQVANLLLQLTITLEVIIGSAKVAVE